MLHIVICLSKKIKDRIIRFRKKIKFHKSVSVSKLSSDYEKRQFISTLLLSERIREKFCFHGKKDFFGIETYDDRVLNRNFNV